MIYTMLTSLIILLGKLRGRFSEDLHFRFDRTLPWPKDQPAWGLYAGCCDCGLSHFFINGKSGTPVRPNGYGYRIRFGARGHAEPDAGVTTNAERNRLAPASPPRKTRVFFM